MRSLLQAGDPPPFEILNPDGRSDCILICEHAGNLVPAALGRMGLDDDDFGRHYAVDIGARGVTEHLSRLLDAPAIVATYSRLVVDINRTVDHETTFPVTGEGKPIPGNVGISAADKAQRINEIYKPFDQAVQDVMNAVLDHGGRPMLLAVHSYTPVFFGTPRPWECAVLWREDWPMSRAMINHLRALNPHVGDNEPYDSRKQCFGTLDRHAGGHGDGPEGAFLWPHALVEIRNNLIQNDKDQQSWAEILAGVVGKIMADESNRGLPPDTPLG
ncbi:N-formylglutamate amidohydrolase [Micavibrio aeruginosavorus]|uniref:N-formylglutamate amidohydrolase n=1 Tax=Micavibrio aeruginosavorus TaxID=349221 RepID=UPI003F4ABC32